MSEDRIEELYGLVSSPGDVKRMRKATVDPFQTSGMARNIQRKIDPSIAHECGHRLSAWQSMVYRRLIKRSGDKDMIVSVPPAAGKTMPITCAWKKLFINFLQRVRAGDRSVRVPRIAVIVPTTQLAMQIGKQDFLRDSNSGLLKMIAEHPLDFQEFLPNVRLSNPNNNSVHRDPKTGQITRNMDPSGRLSQSERPDLRKLTYREIDDLYRMLDNEFVGILYGGTGAAVAKSMGGNRNLFGGLKPIVVGTYKPMEGLLKKHGKEFDIVVIDETQEFLGRPGETSVSSGLKEKQEAFINAIKYTPKESALLLLTGSTNDKSVEDIKDLINSEFGRKLSKYPSKIPGKDVNKEDDPKYYNKLDKASRNRSNISIMPYDKMQSLSDIKTLCKDIIKRNQKNSIMLLFSIKRTAATGILRIVEDLILKLPVLNTDLYSRVSKKNDKSGTVNIGINNVDDYKSSRKDVLSNQQLTAAQLADRDSKDFIDNRPDASLKPDDIRVDEIEFLKYFDYRPLESGGTRGTALEEPDSDNLLYQGVLRGIGIMTGSMHQRHKETIQKLFKSGKLPLLFASDALGV